MPRALAAHSCRDLPRLCRLATRVAACVSFDVAGGVVLHDGEPLTNGFEALDCLQRFNAKNSPEFASPLLLPTYCIASLCSTDLHAP